MILMEGRQIMRITKMPLEMLRIIKKKKTKPRPLSWRTKEDCKVGPTHPLKLTCDGVVTLISGTKLSSKKLMMFSCFSSFVGVSLGSGGTGGPFLS